MEHDGNCERHHIGNFLWNHPGISVEELDGILSASAEVSLACLCRERLLNPGFFAEVGWKDDLAAATMARLRYLRSGTGIGGKEAVHLVNLKRGWAVEENVIEVDFRARRRVK